MRKALLSLLALVVLGVGGAYVYVRRAPGPAIEITAPQRFMGAATRIEIAIGGPGQPSDAQVFFEQDGARRQVAGYSAEAGPMPGTTVNDIGGDRIQLSRTIDRQAVPGLKSGSAAIVVTASRTVLPVMPAARSSAMRDVRVRLERPTVSVVSTKHYVNLGGSEMVVYRVSPDDVQSGVRVGDLDYPGFPAKGAVVNGMTINDPALRIAFFALRYDQKLDTPISITAHDEAGNTARGEFDYRTFPKPFKHSRIPLDDPFMNRVVPAILQGTSEVNPTGSLIEKYVVVNSELRKKNSATIAALAAQTSPEMLWNGVPFHAFGNTKVEAAFADFRTYVYEGRDVDHEVHLGFDLASFAHAPVVAANRGRVLWAADLGIYGNCVIIDHGMGVQSLYGHLSAIEVKPGQMVEKDQPIGRSGMTGLAAGDHLHFTMLVNGQMVNPLEWWDPHWIQDRIVRKLHEAR